MRPCKETQVDEMREAVGWRMQAALAIHIISMLMLRHKIVQFHDKIAIYDLTVPIRTVQ